MKTLALVLGGGHTLHDDIDLVKSLGLPYTHVYACNDAGAEWPDRLDGWVSLHPEKYDVWTKKREQNGYEPAQKLWAHRDHKRSELEIQIATISFPGQKGTGSSGLFAAKVAMVNCRIDYVVFCGVPMTQTPHFFDNKPWKSNIGFRRQWMHVRKDFRDRMRSCSGWSRVLLGGPHGWKDGVC